MMTEQVNQANLAVLLETFRQELARLRERVAALEAASPAQPPVAPPTPAPLTAPAAPKPDELSEELVLVLGAAVAAFLGKKAPIRQIRVVGSPVWARQGRVTIQASHQLP